MIAYKPLQRSSAFRLYCKAIGKNISEYDEIAKNLAEKSFSDEDFKKTYPEWADILDESIHFRGVIESIAPSPCFEKDTLVMTSNGYKKIQDIKTGDYVMTHNNRFKVVKMPMKTYKDQALKIKFMGSQEIITTDNHPFYIRHNNGQKLTKVSRGKYSRARAFTDPEWVRAENIKKGDYVGIAINQNSIIPEWNGIFDYGRNKAVKNINTSNKNFWWLVGRYLGDGWTHKYVLPNGHIGYYRTTICCNHQKNECQTITKYLDELHFNYNIVKERTVYKIQIGSKELFEFLDQFGHGAINKHLTNTVLDLPVDYLKIFLEGYFSADGHFVESGSTQMYTTISKELAVGIQQCIYKVYHVPTRFNVQSNSGNVHLIENRLVNVHTAYNVSFTYQRNKRDQGFYEDGYIWVPFRESKIIEYHDYLYNMSVEDDESYTVNNMIVHNCSFLLSNDNISETVGLIRVGEEICCALDGYNCDVYKFLKNDYLTVSVYELIDKVYKLIGRPIDDISTLVNNCDDKVWDIYAKGLTTTINQADSDMGKQLIMKYKPTNLAELSAWVAAIRPGFASLLDTFINREPYSTGEAELDNLLKDSYHFMMYQENIMSFLVWLGIEEKGTYDIIKKIAKKKFKEDELQELKEKLKKNWLDKIGNTYHFEANWQVVQDAAAYSFNASHALSVAIDSLYGAYLKSHYPLEYFTVALSMYTGDMKRTSNLTDELNYFNINIKPVKFRKSNADYTMDKETNSIYKGLCSVKFMNEQVANSLYELRNKRYNNFFEFLLDYTGDSKQLKILIKLDFFSEFGKPKKLLGMVSIFSNWYGKKVIKKTPGNMDIYNLLKSYGKETEKQLSIKTGINLDMISLLAKDIKDEDISVKEHIDTQLNMLGYLDYINPELSERLQTVIEINCPSYAIDKPICTLYNLKTGKTVVVHISKSNTFKNNPFKVGSLLDIFVGDIREEYKKTKDENGKWVQSDETKLVLDSYDVLIR